MRLLTAVMQILFIGCIALLCPVLARAQTPSPLAEWQYSSGIQLQQLFMPKPPDWEVEAGVGTALAPAATGLRHVKVQFGPAFDIRYKNLAFLSPGEGLGMNLLSSSHFTLGGALTYNLGRAPRQDRKVLEGMGTIHPVPEFKIFASLVLSKSFPLTIRFDVRKQLKGSNGYIGDLGAYLPMPGSSEKFVWFLGPTLTVADTRYMTTYYGVNHNQAAATRYKYYKPGGGLASTGLGLSTNYFFTKHILVNFTGAYARLLGSAKNSPLTQTPNQGQVALALMYKF